MLSFLDGYRIIENIEEEKDLLFEESQCGHTDNIQLTKNHLEALLDGRCIAYNNTDDVVSFITLDKTK